MLSYESGAGGHPGRYNGSISGVEWRNGGAAIFLYLPEYNGFDRLSGVEEYRQTASGWEKNPVGYEERGIVYDRNGNIKSLQRTAGGKVVLTLWLADKVLDAVEDEDELKHDAIEVVQKRIG